MRVNRLSDDTYLLIGETYRSNSTAFVSEGEVLLVDALGSDADAVRLKGFVEDELGKQVRFIISTHYFSDHIAALRLFPRASVVAHRSYRETFDSEMYRSEEEAAFFVEPDILVSDGVAIRWGRYTLDVFHNPGHTASTLSIDVPEADLLFVGDTLVGNIAYLNYSTPERFFAALASLQARARGRLLSSHGDVRSPSAIGNARFYLERLGDWARESLNSGKGRSHADAVEPADAPLDNFLPNGITGTPFEKMFHERNLRTVVERRLFAPSA